MQSDPMPALVRLRLQRGAEHLHRLGPRATAEALAEIAEATDGRVEVLAVLGRYRDRLTPQMVRAAGADAFPPLLVQVPA